MNLVNPPQHAQDTSLSPQPADALEVTDITLEEAGAQLKLQLPALREELRGIDESRRVSSATLNFRFSV